jgi:hypothetical protein
MLNCVELGYRIPAVTKLNSEDLVYHMPLPKDWQFIPSEWQHEAQARFKRGTSCCPDVPIDLPFLCTDCSILQTTCDIPTVPKTFGSKNMMVLSMSL